jgi:hypothetical protein
MVRNFILFTFQFLSFFKKKESLKNDIKVKKKIKLNLMQCVHLHKKNIIMVFLNFYITRKNKS